MLNKTKRDQIISLINREVVPALGCTEPVAVALCVAKARELLGEMPEKIRLSLSGNIIKNAMGVGIPGTGMIGLPIAVALGALIGKSDLGLEVLQEVPSNLFIDTVVSHGTQTARAVISRNHTHFVFLEKNGERLYEEEGWNNADAEEDEAEAEEVQLDMKTVYEFATESPIEEISFIQS